MVKEEIEKVKVTFNVQLDFELDNKFTQIYLVGNTKEIGIWNPKKAIDLKKKGNMFIKTKTFNKYEVLEFKFLLEQTFDTVELDKAFQEIENRFLVCDETKTVNILIENFKL